MEVPYKFWRRYLRNLRDSELTAASERIDLTSASQRSHMRQAGSGKANRSLRAAVCTHCTSDRIGLDCEAGLDWTWFGWSGLGLAGTLDGLDSSFLGLLELQ